jgi:AcrR family transcriptional regulator
MHGEWPLARFASMEEIDGFKVAGPLDPRHLRLDIGAGSRYSFERTFDSDLFLEKDSMPRSHSALVRKPLAKRGTSLSVSPNDNGHRGHHNGSFDRKLQHILRHAANVFAEKGFEGASIRDISRASGVSLSGLYYYFESKQKLLYLIQTWAFTSIVQQLEARLARADDPVDRLRILVRNHLEFFLSHPVQMKVLSHEAEALEAPYHAEVAEIKRRYYNIALGIFQDLQRNGLARRISARIAVLSLFGMMNWIYTWHNPKVDPRAESLAEVMTAIFLDGVSNGHGARTSNHVSRITAQLSRRNHGHHAGNAR